MQRSQAVDEENGLQIWMVVANIFIKGLWTADKGVVLEF
jgi:hypothetical protein